MGSLRSPSFKGGDMGEPWSPNEKLKITSFLSFDIVITSFNKEMCWLFKKKKKREISINRALNREEIIKKLTFCQRIDYWMFFGD